jgi:hypothetical protein
LLSDVEVKRQIYARAGAKMARVVPSGAVQGDDVARLASFASRHALPSSPLLVPVYNVLDEGINSLFVYTGWHALRAL